MQAVNAEVDGGTFSRLDDFLFHLLAHLRYYLFNACGVDASVGDEVVESKTADFTTNGVEGTDDDGFGRIVNDDFNASGSFQGTDVATFATDDAPLHLIVFDVEDGDGVFDGGLRGYALYALNDDALCLFVGSEFCLVNDFVDVALRLGLRLGLHGLHEAVASLIGRKSAELFQFLDFTFLSVSKFCLTLREVRLLAVNLLLHGVELLLATPELLMTLVNAHFALLELVLLLRDA